MLAKQVCAAPKGIDCEQSLILAMATVGWPKYTPLPSRRVSSKFHVCV